MKDYNLPETRIIETERLYLKVMTPEIWNYMLTELDNIDIKVFLGLYQPGQVAKEKEKNRLGMTTHAISFTLYLMVDKETKSVIGKIGYHNWQEKHNRSEIGYAMDIEEYKNKGYMSEAMKAVLTDGFEQLKLHRVYAMIGPHNTPSIKLAEKFSFVKEGLMRQDYNLNGEQVDSVCYSLLRHEYDSLKQTW